MRLLFYSSYYSPYISGLTTYPDLLLTHLSTSHQISVLTFKHDPALKAKEVIHGVQVSRMSFLFKISKGFISPQSLWFFIYYLIHSDVVMINLPNVEALPLVVFARLLGKPVISIFHCQVTLGVSLSERVISKILNGVVYLELLFSQVIVAYTQDYISSLHFPRVITDHLIYVLPPISLTPPSSSYFHGLIAQKQKQIWLGFAGRFAREKGLEVLLDAYHHLPHKNQYRLIFAGPSGQNVVGEGSYSQKIEARLIKEQIPHLFLGTLHDANLTAFYQAIDVLILPSINQTEAFGMVQVEAMLAGTPVIATDLPGVRQPIQLTGMGEIIPINDSPALAQAITQVCTHKQKYVHPDSIARTRQLFNLHHTIAAYKKILEKL
jgi:glycosyltransferase involved in cell wall biosynthesis